ncbi:MAG: hypothetical protein COB36_02375 [Alphaproteobacteria bacterium]|nr:MAG: hypothetical protein COB36_02375 [Alphaproteobacteria bacterium]
MAHTILNNFLMDSGTQESASDNTQKITVQNNGQSAELPDASYVRSPDITRNGAGLALETADGTVVIEGYYAVEPIPNLVAADLFSSIQNSATEIGQDNNDTLNFTNSGNSFSHTGLDQTSSYDVYTDATVTLLVDLDHSAVSSII